MSLDQAFAHCPIFSAAATRRCLGRVAVPVLGNKLSLPLTVIALVGHYPANKLIVRRLINNRLAPFEPILANKLGIGNYPVFRRTMPVLMVDTYVLLTRSPLTLVLRFAHHLFKLKIKISKFKILVFAFSELILYISSRSDTIILIFDFCILNLICAERSEAQVLVRLACLIHIASVHPGPGSNPQ